MTDKNPDKPNDRADTGPEEQADSSSRTNNEASETTTAHSTSTASGTSPIEIRQASCGKFGVFQARRQPSQADPNSGLLFDANGEPIPLDNIIKTANTMSSLMIAHKIALEDDFRLEPGMDISGPLMNLSPIIGSSPSGASGGQKSDEPSLQSRVKDIVHEAYWDLFKEELDSQTNENTDERKYDLSKQLLTDVKQKMLELLLPQHARLKQDIEDKLDAQIINQLTKTHSINLMDYGHYILSVLSKLCAPVRDEKLKELSETVDTVQVFRGIMELLELMRLDFANFTLNHFKPHIKAHSQDYEREKFNEILKQQRTIGIDGLEYTKIWLERAVKRVNAIHGLSELVNESTNIELDLSGSDGAQTASSSANDHKLDQILRSDIINKVLNTAYCELLEWTPKTQKLYPETLLFDEATFKQLKEQYKVLLLTSSILLTIFSFVNRLKLQDSNEFRVLIKSQIITLLTASYDNNQTTSMATRQGATTATDQFGSTANNQSQSSVDDSLDIMKLETVVSKLCDDLRIRIQETNKTLLNSYENEHQELLKRQILDIQNPSNRVRELARRRIIEFVETLLDLDVKHQQKKFSSKMTPPVNIPLGLNCLTDEITLTMAQLVKIIRYNRRVFFHHYQDIIAEQVSRLI